MIVAVLLLLSLNKSTNVSFVDCSTPSKVKFDVFRRVNTGGKPLNNQEIRNCLASDKTRKLINELANMEEFKIATGGSVRTTRMQAQEIVLRFISFYNFLHLLPVVILGRPLVPRSRQQQVGPNIVRRFRGGIGRVLSR